ncbi:MAG TPA: hypothetical protein VKV32_05340 [Stellaceae bacterium]|nr:hypothetical protein [Stellaceae bacterium]
MPLDLDRIDQIIGAFATILNRRTIARELEELKRFTVEPEQIDEQVLAAIQASFCLDDDRLARETPRLSLERAAEAA